jgi:hypothetical protein
VNMGVDVIRTAPPVQYVTGGSQVFDGQTITEITEKGGAPPGVPVGLVRIVNITFNPVSQAFTGSTSDGILFSGQAGKAITVAGSSSKIPDVTFTVSIDNPIAPTTTYQVVTLTNRAINIFAIPVSGPTGSSSTLPAALVNLPIQLSASFESLTYNPITKRYEETVILHNTSRTAFWEGGLASNVLDPGQSVSLVLDFADSLAGLTASIARIVAEGNP